MTGICSGCQVEVGGDVFINKVGTFGVASASYYWSRAASALGRLTQYITGRTANTWHQLVADDFHLEASGPEYRAALISFFVLCATAGVPLSWEKTAGGDKVTWVGFELLHISYHLAISEQRAAWFTKWAEEVASSHPINTASFEEGLGRLMCVAGALEYERPFLSPLCCFLSLHPRGAVRRVPAYAKYFLRYLSRQVSLSRHYNCAMMLRSLGYSPSGGRTGKSRQDRGRWLGTRTRRRRTPRSLEIQVVQPRDHKGRVAVDLRTQRQARTVHLDPGGTGRADTPKNFSTGTRHKMLTLGYR